MATFKILGDVVNDPSANNIGSATTVRVVATAGTVTGTVNLADDTKERRPSPGSHPQCHRPPASGAM